MLIVGGVHVVHIYLPLDYLLLLLIIFQLICGIDFYYPKWNIHLELNYQLCIHLDLISFILSRTNFVSFLFSNWIFVYDRFAFTGIMIYIAWDAYANPNHKDRVGFFNSKAYPELQGCQSMYMLPLVSGMVEYLSGKHRPHGTLLGLLAPTAVRLIFHLFFFFWFFFVGFCYC